MKVYVSLPMTKAGPAEAEAGQTVCTWLPRFGLEFYYPPTMEPAGKTLAELQEYDLQRMAESAAVLVVWTPRTPDSRGVNAEIEWAARLFKIPVWVWNVEGEAALEGWPAATVKASGGDNDWHLRRLIERMVEQYERTAPN